ncbi:hypothetical protein ACG97_03475 [Vogesella sp. EB]|nr:hypothetical protein ACG97_03475 [Vogesella sp. EB]
MIVKYLAPALLIAVAANLAVAGALGKDRPVHSKQNWYEEEAPWQEASVPLIDYPASFDWREIEMPGEVKQRVFIDAGSIQIGSDGVTRFSLRQLSSKGAENISREGVHCNERSLRSYGFADPEGKRWIESTKAKWQKASFGDPFRQTMLKNLCPDGLAPRNAEALLANLNKPDARPRKK